MAQLQNEDSTTDTLKGTAAMTGTKTQKVYELAKELGLESMALLDKLKQLDINVKSHMSSLGSEEVKAIKEHLAKEQALKTKVSKAASKKKEVDTSSVQKRVGATVIRRRAKSAAEEAAGSTAHTEDHAATPLTHVASEEMVSPEVEKVELSTSASVSVEATPEAPIAEKDEPTPTVVEPKKTASDYTITTTSKIKIPSLLGAKNEGMTTKTGSILKIVKEEPIKRDTPVIRPKVPGAPAGSANQKNIVNLGKDAIEKLIEEEQNFKKKTPGAKTDRDVADVKFADYRAKKELIFLPKKKKLPINKEIRKTEITTPAAHKRVVRIENTITVAELAARMSVKSNEIMKKLIAMGVMATLNQALDLDTASLLAAEFQYEIENVAFKEENIIKSIEDQEADLKPRPPIVTVMGHVDHGKTSLLDAIRSANVAAGEAGGITQHIGAYTVNLNGKFITFIDTPGHEAFTVMRARGANVTDIVILVVAADDGVMPQTREAVDHARAANVPIIVAVNKIDKPGANPDKVIKGLSEVGLVPEAWGGDSIFVNVSALKKTGVKDLLENILLQAEVLDLKANPNRLAEGTVLEARLDKNRGPVVNILIKKGTLNTGDYVVAGQYYGKVRALTDDKGKPMKSIGPSYAAELLGLEGVALAGDLLHAFKTEAEARQVVEHRQNSAKAANAQKTSKMTLEDLFSKVEQGQTKELAVVLKTDVFGSNEAIKESLNKLATEKVKIKVLSASTGGINEGDVMLAAASNAIIIGFNVRPETKARALAEKEGIEIKSYSIIYELLDDMKNAMAGVLDKKAVEKYLGRAEVRETFSVPKIGTIAGCAVIDGKILRGCQVRLLRDSRVIYTGKLSSLRRFKDDVKEVAQGYECGMSIENYNDVKQGDLMEAFIIEMIAQDIGSPTSDKKA